MNMGCLSILKILSKLLILKFNYKNYNLKENDCQIILQACNYL